MVRKAFVQRKVLEVYQSMDKISYPIQPEHIVSRIPQNCRILTYQTMAGLNNCSIQDIAVMCRSSSGATHHDVEHDRYLILYNSSMNQGRILWTLCHEAGHICIGHFNMIEDAEIACTDWREPYSEFESEADYFAWNLIAPLPIIREMEVNSMEEIQSIFGFSSQAAALQYDRYVKWCRGHIKTAWENTMVREFRKKYTVA